MGILDRDFWLGKEYKQDPMAYQNQDAAGFKGQLQDMYGQLGRPDAFAQGQQGLAGMLQGIASGSKMGAGQMAAQRAGQQALAQQQAMAAGARGYGSMAAQRMASRNSASIGTMNAGAMAQAGLQDQANAQGLLANVYAQGRQGNLGISQAQLAALAQAYGISADEMAARMAKDQMNFQVAQNDIGVLPAAAQQLTSLGAAYIGRPGGR